jgi:hypothetical protein
MPKQDLEKLVGSLEQLSPEDAELVMALAEKYGIPTEYAEEAPAEVPVEEAVLPVDPTMMEQPAPEEMVVAAEEALPPLPEEAVEAVIEQAPVEEGMEVLPEVPVEEIMPEPDPAEEVKMMVADLGSQLAALKSEIEALKSTLEQVAVREPVSEEEVNAIEASKNNIGQRTKGQPSNVPDRNVMNDLIKKLGGMSK